VLFRSFEDMVPVLQESIARAKGKPLTFSPELEQWIKEFERQAAEDEGSGPYPERADFLTPEQIAARNKALAENPFLQVRAR